MASGHIWIFSSLRRPARTYFTLPCSTRLDLVSALSTFRFYGWNCFVYLGNQYQYPTPAPRPDSCLGSSRTARIFTTVVRTTSEVHNSGVACGQKRHRAEPLGKAKPGDRTHNARRTSLSSQLAGPVPSAWSAQPSVSRYSQHNVQSTMGRTGDSAIGSEASALRNLG